MKKKGVLIGLAIVLALGVGTAFIGCGSSEDETETKAQTEAVEDQATEEQTAEEQAAEVVPVTIDSYKVITLKDGNALEVSITWTNEDEDSKAFFLTYDALAFQNGVELERTSAFMMGDYDDETDYYADQQKVQSGKSQTFVVLFELTDESPVTIQVTDLFGSDTLVSQEATL